MLPPGFIKNGIITIIECPIKSGSKWIKMAYILAFFFLWNTKLLGYRFFFQIPEETLIGGRVYLRVFWVYQAEVMTFDKLLIRPCIIENKVREA